MITLENFNLLVYIWMGMALILFPVMLFVTVPYGRHSTKTWGPMVNNRLGWFVMEFPALFLFVFLTLKGNGFPHYIVLGALILWFIHYFHRSIIFPIRIHTKGKKMPLVIMLFALFFNFVNGGINGYWFGYLSPGYPEGWLSSFQFIGGVSLFVIGFFINQYHDRLLIMLRKSSTNGYKIPYGGLFQYVSCPNFLGEIIEWGGFALMTWCLPTLSFFVWTLANLVPRALDHHKWYKSHFKDYPKDRNAIFPKLL
jgi:hypothetical protein